MDEISEADRDCPPAMCSMMRWKWVAGNTVGRPGSDRRTEDMAMIAATDEGKGVPMGKVLMIDDACARMASSSIVSNGSTADTIL